MFIDFRERGRERERERNTNQLPPVCSPTREWTPNLGMFDQQSKSNPQPFGVRNDSPTNWATDHGRSATFLRPVIVNNTVPIFKISFTLLWFAMTDSCYPQVDPQICEDSCASSLFSFLGSCLRWQPWTRTGGEPDRDNATNSSQPLQKARFRNPFFRWADPGEEKLSVSDSCARGTGRKLNLIHSAHMDLGHGYFWAKIFIEHSVSNL